MPGKEPHRVRGPRGDDGVDVLANDVHRGALDVDRDQLVPELVGVVRDAGRALGEVLASCVSFFNPSVIVIGGDLAEVHEQLLAGVREVTFSRSLPLATGDLQTVPSRLGDRAGVIGAAVLVIEHVLTPDMIDRAIEAASVA